MNIEDNIRPLWKDKNWYFWNHCTNKLDYKILEIIALINTRRALCFISLKKINKDLPRLKNSFEKNIHFHPFLKTNSIICNKSTSNFFKLLNITKYLISILFLPCKIFLDVLGQTFVSINCLEICFDGLAKWSTIKHEFFLSTHLIISVFCLFRELFRCKWNLLGYFCDRIAQISSKFGPLSISKFQFTILNNRICYWYMFLRNSQKWQRTKKTIRSLDS